MGIFIDGSIPGTLDLAPESTRKEVAQNVAVILATQKGDCPMYRDFGIDSEYIDKPENIGRSMFIAAVTEAVETYEPRAKVRNVEITGGTDGRLTARVEVDING